jgi:hypothetical protein
LPGYEEFFGGVWGGGVDDEAVAEEDDAVGPGGVACFVGDEHAGRSRVDPCSEEFEDAFAGL